MPAGIDCPAEHDTVAEPRARRPIRGLPAAPSALIGRSEELASAGALLRGADTRLLTLLGPGGVGKTRLALELGHRLGNAFDEGARFVDLTPVGDPELVLPTIARALEVMEEPDRPPLDTLLDALRGWHLLLILDNVEQVVAAAPAVADLLAGCPRLTVVATSRVPLRIRAERSFPVAPLALPERSRAGGGPAPTVKTLAANPAVALFLDRVLAAAPGFALTEENGPVIAEICRRVDGLPLAIELAAGWSRMLSPGALLARLDDRLGLLGGGPRDLPERQRTLRGTVAWSYDLLSGSEQRLFRLLATFVGGCSLDAAVAMATGADDIARDRALGAVGLLVDHNLLGRQENRVGEPRVAMLETIRDYGLERLEADGERDEARRRHAANFLHLAERAEPELLGGREQGAWLDRLEADAGNMRAALDWAAEQDRAEHGLRLSGALEPFWRLRGGLREGRARLEQALGRGTGGSRPARAKALVGAAVVALSQGHLADAAAYGDEALAIWRGLNDRAGLARGLNVLGACAILQGDLELAAGRLEEALALRRSLGDEAGVASVLLNLGSVAVSRGDAARATALFEETLALSRTLGDSITVALTLRGLGELAQGRGDTARATALCEEALALNRTLGDKADAAWSLVRLGDVALDQGDDARGVAVFGEALDLAREVGDEPAAGEALVGLGRATARRGESDRAGALLEEALAVGQGLDDAVITGSAWTALGDLARRRGDGVEATRCFRGALTPFAGGDERRAAIGPLAGAALLLGQTRRQAPATRLLGATEALREAVGVVLPAAEQPEHERAVADAKAALGGTVFAAEWEAGRTLSAAEAVAEALTAIADVPAELPAVVSAKPMVGAARAPAGLSGREVEVLRLLAGGLTNAQIAERLYLSPHTVSAHLRRIYDKLEVTSRSAATRFAMEHNLA